MENYYIKHHGVPGMKWGVRRYQNEDGSLTPRGKIRQAKQEQRVQKLEKKGLKNEAKEAKRLENPGKSAIKSGFAAYGKTSALGALGVIGGVGMTLLASRYSDKDNTLGAIGAWVTSKVFNTIGTLTLSAAGIAGGVKAVQSYKKNKDDQAKKAIGSN